MTTIARMNIMMMNAAKSIPMTGYMTTKKISGICMKTTFCISMMRIRICCSTTMSMMIRYITTMMMPRIGSYMRSNWDEIILY